MEDMNIVLLGEGAIGKTIKEFFTVMGYNVISVDLVGNPDVKGNIQDVLPDLCKNNPTIVSALPYSSNAIAAQIAINNSCNYYDLGGHTQTTEKIKSMAQWANCKVFSGLGLAPGHVNIVAELMYRNNPCSRIDMYCGGIPSIPNKLSVLNYKSTWSIDGLVNEYYNTYYCVENGFKKTIELNDRVHITEFPLSNKYECAHTSGCTDSQIDDFLQRKCDLNYYTMRYRGHFELFRKLYSINPNIIDEILVNDSKLFEQDKVKIAIMCYKSGDRHSLSNVVTETYYPTKYSAMQRTTAAGAVAGVIELNSVGHSGYMSYTDFSEFYLDIFDKLMNLN